MAFLGAGAEPSSDPSKATDFLVPLHFHTVYDVLLPQQLYPQHFGFVLCMQSDSHCATEELKILAISFSNVKCSHAQVVWSRIGNNDNICFENVLY